MATHPLKSNNTAATDQYWVHQQYLLHPMFSVVVLFSGKQSMYSMLERLSIPKHFFNHLTSQFIDFLGPTPTSPHYFLDEWKLSSQRTRGTAHCLGHEVEVEAPGVASWSRQVTHERVKKRGSDPTSGSKLSG